MGKISDSYGIPGSRLDGLDHDATLAAVKPGDVGIAEAIEPFAMVDLDQIRAAFALLVLQVMDLVGVPVTEIACHTP